MTPSDFQRVREVFGLAIDTPPSGRDACLDQAGPPGSPLRREVEALLAESASTGGPLDAAAVEDGAAAELADVALERASDPMLGRSIGGCVLKRVIGAGGMGRVYLAEQANPARTVAVKLVRAAGRRAEREAAALARLRHPGIAQIYEVGRTPDGWVYLVMELIENACPVTIAAARLSIREKCLLLADVCDAVHHGHQRGVIHRDLKPANILVEPGRAGPPGLANPLGPANPPGLADTLAPGGSPAAPLVPKVIDFGIARLTESQDTVTAQPAGTPAYMSPEQCGGDPAELDIRADVYALGVVLYQTLSGELPIDVRARTPLEAARRIADTPPRPLAQSDPRLAGDLSTIVHKAIAKDRADRYASAAHLGADLRCWTRHQPIAARPPSMLHQARLLARRNTPLVLAGAALALVLAGSAVGGVLLAARATFAAEEARAAGAIARAERDRALRVAAFMQGALGSANPFLPTGVPAAVASSSFEPFADWRMTPWPSSGKPGQAATVTDVIIAATYRLQDAFADDPAERAALGDVLGRSLYNLNSPADAGRTLALALRDAKAAHGEDHELTIRVSLHYAEYLAFYKSDEPRDQLFASAIRACRTLYGPGDARTLDAHRQYAYDLYAWRAQPAQAADHLFGAVQEAIAAGAGEQPVTQQTLAYAGFLRAWAGRVDEGEATTRAAVEKLESLIPAGAAPTPELAEACRLHAMALRRRPGSARAAAISQTRAAEIFAAVFGPGSHRAVTNTVEAGGCWYEAREWPEAERLLRRAADGFARLLGEHRFETQQARLRLCGAIFSQDQDHAELAAQTGALLASLARDPNRLPAETWSVRFMEAYAHAALARPGALARLRDLIAEADSRPQDVSDVSRARARIALAERLLALGALADAQTLAQEARGLLARPGLDSAAGDALTRLDAKLPARR